ncbi:MAG: hypothetical protein M3395_03825 [Chloroflexota bacterium]|nr:hypothetical protein [Chloroflexota bacterium]
MDLIPAAAALVVVAGAGLAAVARSRLALLAGVMSALALVPLCRSALPEATSWSLGALAYLVGILLGGYLLWVATRRSGGRLAPGPTLLRWSWLVLAGVALGVGIAAWPFAVAWLDPSRASGAWLAEWWETGGWSLGAGLALAVVGLGRLLAASEAARLAAGTAFVSAGAWLMVSGLGAATPDVTLPVMGLVLPIAAATAAAHHLRPARAR